MAAKGTKPAPAAPAAAKPAAQVSAAKKDERIPLKYAEKLLADNIITADQLAKMKADGKVTSGVGFGGESVHGQLVEFGLKDTDVNGLFGARDIVNEALEKLGDKAKGFKIIIYLKHPKADAPATDAKKS